jgi:3-phosphoglycerate kinase
MKSIKDIDVADKRVLIRGDFNVSLDKQGKVIDDFRIRATMPTLQYLIEQGAKIILLAHLGRPLQNQGGRSDITDLRERFSLKPIANRLVELLQREIKLAPDCIGEGIRELAMRLEPGEILMLENLRFHQGEEANDESFARSLAEMGEIYVNDAFAVSHRAHASVEAITRFLPSFAGFLLSKELDNLLRARDNPDHPLTVIIGGAKMSTKIKLIQTFLNKAENIILGGALANTVLHAKGIAVGKSIIEESMVPEINKLEVTDTKIHLPVDALVCASREDVSSCHPGPIGMMQQNESIFDIGFDSQKLFSRVINSSKMIVWNGPMGLFEVEAFASGTKAIAEAIADSAAYSIVGGGETVAYLEKIGLVDKFSFVSTGGGAMLEFLAGEKLPGLIALDYK